MLNTASSSRRRTFDTGPPASGNADEIVIDQRDTCKTTGPCDHSSRDRREGQVDFSEASWDGSSEPERGSDPTAGAAIDRSNIYRRREISKRKDHGHKKSTNGVPKPPNKIVPKASLTDPSLRTPDIASTTAPETERKLQEIAIGTRGCCHAEWISARLVKRSHTEPQN